MRSLRRWIPAAVLAAGCLMLLLAQRQRIMTLRLPLSQLPRTLNGVAGQDVPISEAEQRIAGMSSFVFRIFADSTQPPAFSVYVGYYEAQSQGKSIHSPKNCLPGAGWEPLDAGRATLLAQSGEHRVNRYMLAKGRDMALVYYWYQGRGRVQASEYAVKWELLRDKAIAGRSEEALVRIVVPVLGEDVAAADSLAGRLGAQLVDELERHLPAFPGRDASGD
jgi:EpsI family protein